MAEEEYTLTTGWRQADERDYWLARLTSLGFSPAEAEILTDTVALSLHQVEAAVSSGCPLTLAFEIFS